MLAAQIQRAVEIAAERDDALATRIVNTLARAMSGDTKPRR